MSKGLGGKTPNTVAGVAAALIVSALSVTPASAGPLLCGSGGFSALGPERCQTDFATYVASPFGDSNTYSFDGGLIEDELTFDETLRTFTLPISAFFFEPGNQDFVDYIGGHTPVEYVTNTGPRWLLFYVEDLCTNDTDECTEPRLGREYGPDNTGDGKAWEMQFTWFSPSFPPSNVAVLHDRRGDPVAFVDITEPGSYEPDPRVVGEANDFSTVTNIQVPEPVTLGLLALGGAALVARRLRGDRGTQPR